MNTLIGLNQVRLTSSVLTVHRHAAGAFLSVWDGPDHRVTCCNAVYEPTVYVLFELAVCENSFTPCRCRLDLRLGRPLESLQHGMARQIFVRMGPCPCFRHTSVKFAPWVRGPMSSCHFVPLPV